METDMLAISQSGMITEEHNGDEVAFALAQAEHAKTPLGRRLWEIRARIVASGIPLLAWDEIDQEVAERRGVLKLA